MNPEKRVLLIVIGAIIVIALIAMFVYLRVDNAPTHLSAEIVSSSQIRLSWAGDVDATQYNIYRKKEGAESYARVGFTKEKEFLDEELDPNTTYFYKVTQVVSFKESRQSKRASATTAPGVPTGIQAQATDFQEELQLKIDLFWDYSIGAEEYVVYRSEDEKGIYEKIGTTTNENYSDTDLLPEKTYYYAVTQITEGQEGVYSDEVSATTGAVWECGETLEYGGKHYKTIRIGEQCWFKENLNIAENETDLRCEVERHCYNDERIMCGVYGGLYDFASIACGQSGEGFQGICPRGWRIPSDNDWIRIETELGMRETEIKKYGFRGGDEGSKLAGNYNLWKDGNLRRSSSFSLSRMDALPGGYQPGFNIRLFYNMGESAIFWSSTRANEDEDCTYWEDAYSMREIRYDNTGIRRDCHPASATGQVRCMRDY